MSIYNFNDKVCQTPENETISFSQKHSYISLILTSEPRVDNVIIGNEDDTQYFSWTDMEKLLTKYYQIKF